MWAVELSARVTCGRIGIREVGGKNFRLGVERLLRAFAGVQGGFVHVVYILLEVGFCWRRKGERGGGDSGRRAG